VRAENLPDLSVFTRAPLLPPSCPPRRA